jgi:acyl-CoA hydrolase
MNDNISEYKRKLCTAEQAAAAIRPGFWIDYGFFNGKPVASDRALAARKDELKDVTILAAVTLPPVPEVLSKDPKGEVFTYNDFHFSPLSRILADQMGNVFYNPIMYSECERYYGDKIADPVVVGTPKRNASSCRCARWTTRATSTSACTTPRRTPRLPAPRWSSWR